MFCKVLVIGLMLFATEINFVSKVDDREVNFPMKLPPSLPSLSRSATNLPSPSLRHCRYATINQLPAVVRGSCKRDLLPEEPSR